MHQIRLIWPGTIPQLSVEDLATALKRWLEMLASELQDAVIAFNCRCELRVLASRPESLAKHQSRQLRIRAHFDDMERGKDALPAESARHWQEAAALVEAEEWSQGILPSRYYSPLHGIFDRAYILALYTYDLHLKKIAADLEAAATSNISVRTEIGPLQQALLKATQEFGSQFRQLKEVRDSLEHKEDRARGKDKGGKPLRLPTTPGGGRILILGASDSSTFRTVIHDGSLGSVEISIDALAFVERSLQKILDSVLWNGPPRLHIL